MFLGLVAGGQGLFGSRSRPLPEIYGGPVADIAGFGSAHIAVVALDQITHLLVL